MGGPLSIDHYKNVELFKGYALSYNIGLQQGDDDGIIARIVQDDKAPVVPAIYLGPSGLCSGNYRASMNKGLYPMPGTFEDIEEPNSSGNNDILMAFYWLIGASQIILKTSKEINV